MYKQALYEQHNQCMYLKERQPASNKEMQLCSAPGHDINCARGYLNVADCLHQTLSIIFICARHIMPSRTPVYTKPLLLKANSTETLATFDSTQSCPRTAVTISDISLTQIRRWFTHDLEYLYSTRNIISSIIVQMSTTIKYGACWRVWRKQEYQCNTLNVGNTQRYAEYLRKRQIKYTGHINIRGVINLRN